MDEDQVVELVQIIATYDSRKIDGVTLGAWREASRRARWDFRAACEAVHEHYAHVTTWLMPGHVTELIRATKRHPAPASQVLAVSATPPASAERRRS
ncbi:hypothetical protein [Rhodococcus jostii]|uniref:hypothetical protein n=1 Tax=Rhodococcus jostii TaxID=132919 RepID=UPI0036448E0B